MSVLTKELIAYWKAEAEKYGVPKDLALDHPSGRYISGEEYFELLRAAEVGLGVIDQHERSMAGLLLRFGIALEALEKIETAATLALNLNPTSYIGKVCGSVAHEALKKLELPE